LKNECLIIAILLYNLLNNNIAIYMNRHKILLHFAIVQIEYHNSMVSFYIIQFTLNKASNLNLAAIYLNYL
jgi:hypothetical protein